MSLPLLYLKQKQGTDPYLGHMRHTNMYKSITGDMRVLQYVQCYYIQRHALSTCNMLNKALI